MLRLTWTRMSRTLWWYRKQQQPPQKKNIFQTTKWQPVAEMQRLSSAFFSMWWYLASVKLRNSCLDWCHWRPRYNRSHVEVSILGDQFLVMSSLRKAGSGWKVQRIHPLIWFASFCSLASCNCLGLLEYSKATSRNMAAHKPDGWLCLQLQVTVCVISVCPRQLRADSLPWWPLLSVMDEGIKEGVVARRKGCKKERKRQKGVRKMYWGGKGGGVEKRLKVD